MTPPPAPGDTSPVLDRRRRVRAIGVARAAYAALRRMSVNGWDFTVRVWNKAGDDDIFFLAGGIAFNVLLAAAPFFLLLVGILAYVLQRTVEDPRQAAVEYVLSILPPSQEVVIFTRRIVGRVLEGGPSFGVIGLLLFIWASTRLFGTLRAVLKDIFDLPEERGIVAGKIFDLQMVLVSGTLLVLNTGITLALEAAQRFGVELLGIENRRATQAFVEAWPRLAAFVLIYLMFLLMYRFLPLRRTPWRISLVAATFSSVAWELLKGMFAWYVSDVVDYSRTYGTLLSPVLLVFWVYYSAVVFILGGEVAQVYDLMLIRRKQKELLE
ncbi:MAG: YihY/virulence factor BrkB family protein [Gemmatimonadetes bacterium]|nr:YihY/virulence factor BrkB family protein [Gemmatimonadota bacterium]